MRVFISSIIGGFEPYRDAAATAVRALGHEPIRAEDFGASASTPQQACLKAVRNSDLVVLLLGARYGFRQPSGKSATHEEYDEAVMERKPVLPFVQDGVHREPEQERFVQGVRGWASGAYSASFNSPEELRDEVVHWLHEHELRLQAGSSDPAEMADRAKARVPGSTAYGLARLVVVVAGGPSRRVLRPTELSSQELRGWFMQEAMFGSHAVLEPGAQTNPRLDAGTLALSQRERIALLDEMGTVMVAQPAVAPHGLGTALSAIIQEDVAELIERALAFAGSVLDRLDQPHRITEVLPLAALLGAAATPWRTRAEHQASPNQASINPFQASDPLVQLADRLVQRATIQSDARRIAEDLTELLRRQFRS